MSPSGAHKSNTNPDCWLGTITGMNPSAINMSPRWGSEIVAGFHWWPAAIHFNRREAGMKRAKTGFHHSSFTGINPHAINTSPLWGYKSNRNSVFGFGIFAEVNPRTRKIRLRWNHRNIHESGPEIFHVTSLHKTPYLSLFRFLSDSRRYRFRKTC